MSFILAYVTHPDKETAQKISKELLDQHIIACVNFLPIESMYWWKGNIESSNEIVSLLKTRPENWEKLQEEIKRLHPYETPCIIKMEVEANREYEQWIYAETY